MRRLPAFIIGPAVGLCVASSAWAAQVAHLSASFIPDRLRASTTVGFQLSIASTDGPLPSPLTSFDLQMPAGMGLADSQLGLSSCEAPKLLSEGPNGCSADARVGSGEAQARFLFGPALNEAPAKLTLVRGESEGAGLSMLVYAEATYPVFLALVFPSRLLESAGRFGSHLDSTLPVIPTLPDAPPVSIISLGADLGPLQLTYTSSVHGRTVTFKPQGLSVPGHCPRGGFPFAARLGFQDGTTVVAATTVRCPPTRAPGHRRRGRQRHR